MEIDNFIIIVRSLMWFVLSGVLWLGLKDYFEKKYKKDTKRWTFLKIALMLIVVSNFAILVYAVMQGWTGQ